MNSGQGLGGETGNGVALGDLDAVVTTDTNASAIVWLNQGGTQEAQRANLWQARLSAAPAGMA